MASKKAKEEAAPAPPADDAKKQAAKALKIKAEDVLATRQADEGLYAVTSFGQKVLISKSGVEVLCGPEKLAKGVAKAAALPEAKEEPVELPPLEEDAAAAEAE